MSYHHTSTVTALLTDDQYVQADCYQEMFYWDNLILEGGTDCLSQIIGMGLPLYAAYNAPREQVSKHVQFQCVSPSGECQMVE
jgi:hypothetical protein